MKKAKINSMYGGGGRKRCKERVEESGNSSKSASMTEKGRTNGVRATKALSTIPNNRTIVTRSMEMKTMEQEDEETLYEVEIIEIREEEKNDDNKPMELVEEQEQQQKQKQEQEPQPPANDVAVVENNGDDAEELTLDDWPITFRFDEEWAWSKVRYDSGWYSCWETMNGDFWTPMRDHSQESVWSGDLWEFKP
ncbi:uncharacterized protein LOC108458977 [Gossypium arboreum]|uniref:Uncharacterized protein n=1 Tax=Gossypium arboreum TaxID=29729 RepID=A0ABR0P9S8_GOSAR|nr:uncharacterized protein LOC108458977 [Gossypium arboreum]KAK5817958.1 hypothetical protein PVK06_022887 [Gossypium arboreum]